ncbi:hypothetical protein K438DRAFT_1771244 [Mycena galopus ATCC 62051]|nr:hypothetical protein K438DRAFT_1771244 [Mycena galopus ATCC 62051]
MSTATARWEAGLMLMNYSIKSKKKWLSAITSELGVRVIFIPEDGFINGLLSGTVPWDAKSFPTYLFMAHTCRDVSPVFSNHATRAPGRSCIDGSTASVIQHPYRPVAPLVLPFDRTVYAIPYTVIAVENTAAYGAETVYNAVQDVQ